MASPERVDVLIGVLVERLKVTSDRAYEVELNPSAHPFFAAAENALVAPTDGPGGNGHHMRTHSPGTR